MARNPHTILGALALGAGLFAASAAPAAALTPIPDDGPGLAPNQPLVSIGDAHAYEADGTIQFPISLTKPATQITFVGVQRSNDTTTNADFTPSPVPVAILPPGATSGTISFPLVDDDSVEDPETMTAEIVSVTGGLIVNDGEATGTIYDGDGPVLGADMDQVQEGDPGDDVALSVEATLSYAAPDDITFTLQTQTVGFGAVPGEDFAPVDDTFVIPAGSTSFVVPVNVVSDDVVDDDDGVVMAVAKDPSRGSTWNNTAVGKILDDDEPGDGSDDGSGSGSGTGTDATDSDDDSDDPDSSTTTLDTDTDSTEVAMSTTGGTEGDDDGSGPPLLPIGGLLAAGFAGAWWYLGRRSDDDDASVDASTIDPTGTIRLD